MNEATGRTAQCWNEGFARRVVGARSDRFVQAQQTLVLWYNVVPGIAPMACPFGNNLRRVETKMCVKDKRGRQRGGGDCSGVWPWRWP